MAIIVNQAGSGGDTFLDLCRQLRQEAAIPGNGPASVLNQSGEMKRIVDWIARAYRDIQTKHRNWDFLRRDFLFETIPGQQGYDLVQAGVPELSSWKDDTFRAYLSATGTVDEQWVPSCAWSAFRDHFMMSANRSVTGRPTHLAIKPDKSLVLWPTPNAPYTLTGEYFLRPQVMTVDEDEPVIPEEFRSIVVWQGLMYYAAYESAPDVYAHAQNEYRRTLTELRADQLPEICMAGGLA